MRVDASLKQFFCADKHAGTLCQCHQLNREKGVERVEDPSRVQARALPESRGRASGASPHPNSFTRWQATKCPFSTSLKGGIVMPKLLRELGCEVVELNCEPTGEFAHNPEPLPQNLTEISEVIVREKADLGIVVDPDVDRLAFVSEDGSMFVEEYTLVAVADYILSEKPGNTVSNLSSSRALRDVTERHGGKYYASAVGEVNVVAKMKEVGAVIGGEGNGGVIYPELHYGRDALVGTALFLTWLAKKGMTMTRLRATYPSYYASKNKIELTPAIDVDKVLREVKGRYAGENVNDIDGVKIDFAENWVHLRKSNTEPIIRVYTEAKSMDEADALAQRFIAEIKEICNI